MRDVSPSNLKAILHSKCANFCRLEEMSEGSAEYNAKQGAESIYSKIPLANTPCLLFGSGASITWEAKRKLSKALVQFGFCGGATPNTNSLATRFFLGWSKA